MYAILVDDKNHAKVVTNLSPLDEFTTNYFVPCGDCGDVVLAEYTIDCVCTRCYTRNDVRTKLEDAGWSWEHPGYWQKCFGNRITVIAGTSEYRFDFMFGGDTYDQAYGADLCIDMHDWSDKSPGLRERGCFTDEEMDELELVQHYLYMDFVTGATYNQGKWGADYGSLLEPNGMYLHGEDRDEAIHITKEMLFSEVGEEMTEEQGNIFCDLCAIMMAFLNARCK